MPRLGKGDLTSACCRWCLRGFDDTPNPIEHKRVDFPFLQRRSTRSVECKLCDKLLAEDSEYKEMYADDKPALSIKLQDSDQRMLFEERLAKSEQAVNDKGVVRKGGATRKRKIVEVCSTGMRAETTIGVFWPVDLLAEHDVRYARKNLRWHGGREGLWRKSSYGVPDGCALLRSFDEVRADDIMQWMKTSEGEDAAAGDEEATECAERVHACLDRVKGIGEPVAADTARDSRLSDFLMAVRPVARATRAADSPGELPRASNKRRKTDVPRGKGRVNDVAAQRDESVVERGQAILRDLADTSACAAVTPGRIEEVINSIAAELAKRHADDESEVWSSAKNKEVDDLKCIVVKLRLVCPMILALYRNAEIFDIDKFEMELEKVGGDICALSCFATMAMKKHTQSLSRKCDMSQLCETLIGIAPGERDRNRAVAALLAHLPDEDRAIVAKKDIVTCMERLSGSGGEQEHFKKLTGKLVQHCELLDKQLASAIEDLWVLFQAWEPSTKVVDLGKACENLRKPASPLHVAAVVLDGGIKLMKDAGEALVLRTQDDILSNEYFGASGVEEKLTVLKAVKIKGSKRLMAKLGPSLAELELQRAEHARAILHDVLAAASKIVFCANEGMGLHHGRQLKQLFHDASGTLGRVSPLEKELSELERAKEFHLTFVAMMSDGEENLVGGKPWTRKPFWSWLREPLDEDAHRFERQRPHRYYLMLTFVCSKQASHEYNEHVFFSYIFIYIY
jgi:hypothetical protein